MRLWLKTLYNMVYYKVKLILLRRRPLEDTIWLQYRENFSKIEKGSNKNTLPYDVSIQEIINLHLNTLKGNQKNKAIKLAKKRKHYYSDEELRSREYYWRKI